MIHDFAYRYGFTENKFNFQTFNFGRGGAPRDDRVLLSVQDVSNRTSFATPPDGQRGLCRLSIFTETNRDSAMQNDILIHEMAHGITNRLTGGGTARCLQDLESRGLGEGWSDAMASWIHQNSSTTQDFVIGAYLVGNERGLRRFPYSVDETVNPLSYKDLALTTEEHAIGEIWANILHQVYASLVDAHGFSAKKLTRPNDKEGNIVFMRLFMDALSIQPCNPTFVQARDAWLIADSYRYGGANKCLLQMAFASRGLGLNADESRVNDFSVDADCIEATDESTA